MPYLDKKAIVDSLTKEDIIKIVVSLGSENPKTDSDGNLIFQSVCHGSKSWKLYYYHEPNIEKDYKGRTFHCFSKCSESFGVIELVIRANRCKGKTLTWYKALYYIGQITGKLIEGDPVNSINNNIITDFQWIDRLKHNKKRNRAIPQLSTINENVLELFSYMPHEEWLNDNCSREALSAFEIGYWGEHNAITIPHRDWKNGELIGVRVRYLDERDIEAIGKYTPAQINGKFLSHQLGSNIYGVHVTKEAILKKKKIMLYEAEKSVIQNYSYFGDDCFCGALCGSAFTPTQMKIVLNELQVGEVIYAPDHDYEEHDSWEAEIWYNKQILKLAPLVPYVKVCLIVDTKDRLPYKGSPSDLGKDVLLELLDEKMIITMDEVRRVQEETRKNR